MAENEKKNDTLWLNCAQWQVKPIVKTVAGQKKQQYRVTFKTNESLDGLATLTVPSVIQRDNRWSVPLKPNDVYNVRLCIDIQKEAQIDAKGEPVINPKTGKQYDQKSYDYRRVTGAVVKAMDDKQREEWRAANGKSEPAEKSEPTEELEPMSFEEPEDMDLEIDEDSIDFESISLGDDVER